MLDLRQLYHTGIVVPDIHSAIEAYRRTHATDWTPVEDRDLKVRGPDGPYDIHLRLAYTREGPHHLELIEAVPGSLWDVPDGPAGTPHPLHHHGYWSDDLAGESRRLEEHGCPLMVTTAIHEERATYMAYHRTPNGSLVELVDARTRPGFEAWFAGAPFPRVDIAEL